MSMSRTKKVLIISVYFVVSMLPSSARAADDDKVTGQLEVVGGSLASMMPGQTGWAALVLQAKNKRFVQPSSHYHHSGISLSFLSI